MALPQVITVTLTLREESSHMEHTTDGFGKRRVLDGVIQADVFEVIVDASALVKAIGRKALKNKRGITRVQNGAVLVRALNMRKLDYPGRVE